MHTKHFLRARSCQTYIVQNNLFVFARHQNTKERTMPRPIISGSGNFGRHQGQKFQNIVFQAINAIIVVSTTFCVQR